ncbi:hypothetical protein TNCV_1798691 [Trichonephila clavipes]|uniref:Uncharacterized protein n=1 Tax=Trichonephila clavipes TaxID=2585209 RepID=A0A8X6SNU2_TRICX|nr:hypothetical protein TNCV_1798691 [Trichonephila clavipes]
MENSVLDWKYQSNLELSKVSPPGFDNDSKTTEMSVDVIIQIAPELPRRMKTDAWQYCESSERDADGGGHRFRIVRFKTYHNDLIVLRLAECVGQNRYFDSLSCSSNQDWTSPAAWIGALSFRKIPSPAEKKIAS